MKTNVFILGLAVAVIILLLIPHGLAAEKTEKINKTVVEKPVVIKPTPNKNVVVDLSKLKVKPFQKPMKIVAKDISKVNYTERKYSTDTVKAAKQILGFEPLSKDTDVTIKGKTMATVPEKSKFSGITIHDQCLKYQYGTDRWFSCEARLT